MANRPFIVVHDLLEAVEIGKLIVGRQITFAFEFKEVDGKSQYRFFFTDLGDAHDALDEIAHLHANVVLYDK